MSDEQRTFDRETEVLVVGYGGAGAVAAISAHDSGAKVLILEKMPSGGGNTRISGGMVTVPTEKRYIEYVEKLTFQCSPLDVLEKFVEESLTTDDWIKSLGGELIQATFLKVTIPPMAQLAWRHIPGSDFGIKKQVKGKSVSATPDDPPGQRLWNLLAGNVDKRGIEILTETVAKELIQGPDGEVIGVIAEKSGKEISVMARKAVVLSCGGYEFNETMKWDYLAARPAVANGNPGNTGDGIKMTQKIGAAMWHMSNLACCCGFKTPEYPSAFPIKFYSEHFILVDKYGLRFANEPAIELHDYGRVFSYFDPHKIEHPRIPMYCIFDEVMRRKAPLCDGISGYNRDFYKWSLDNSEEIKKGWIRRGKTVGDLASQIDMDRTILENSVRKYNESCKNGSDTEFSRAKEYLAPLEPSPYYAIPLWPALYNTQGGPKRDMESRVLDMDGQPIPRLYAAGELGSIWGVLYQGGSNNAESIAFGRIAGRNAAAESPWR